MISWLQGKVVFIEQNELTLNVNGTGYLIFIGENTLRKISPSTGQELELSIYTSVKEDHIDLFGFTSPMERRIYMQLLNVNGVGPRTALAIVDQLSPEQIVDSIRQNNAGMFQSISGIGKKTALKILVELENKVELFQSFSSRPVQSQNTETSASPDLFGQQSAWNDIKSALINLGFSDKEAEQTLHQHWNPEMDFDSLLKICLNSLSK